MRSGETNYLRSHAVRVGRSNDTIVYVVFARVVRHRRINAVYGRGPDGNPPVTVLRYAIGISIYGGQTEKKSGKRTPAKIRF